LSVDFGAGELDHLGPLLGICGDEGAEIGGRACKHRVAATTVAIDNIDKAAFGPSAEIIFLPSRNNPKICLIFFAPAPSTTTYRMIDGLSVVFT
jgi:hypothetical protein